MKRTTVMIALSFLSLSSFAQYKKASFFTKDGRTYELGTNASFISDGRRGAPAFSIVFTTAIESSKKLSYYSDIELMLKRRFSYQGEYYSPTTSNVEYGYLSGDAPTYLLLKYGAQYRFINTEKSEKVKLVPYAKLAFLMGIGLKSGYRVTTGSGDVLEGYEVNPSTPEEDVPVGFEGGLGVTYYFSENFGIRFGGIYRQIFHIGRKNEYAPVYYPLISHSGATITLKYRIFTD